MFNASTQTNNIITCPFRIDDHHVGWCQVSFDDELEFYSILGSCPCCDCAWVDGKFHSSDFDDYDDGRDSYRPS